MVNVVFLPHDSSRTCLDIQQLSSTIPNHPNLNIQSTLTPDTEALFWLPNIAQGNTSSELAHLLSTFGSNVKFVQLPMTGVEHFLPLIRSCTHKIQWSCAKGCYANPVAEHALAMCLSLLRGLNRSQEDELAPGEIETLFQKKVLIVGAGSIAKAIHELLFAFDCSINFIDSSSPPEELNFVLKTSDIVVLACPLTAATHDLFNIDTFSKMKPDSMLINVARGEIVSTPALISAMKQGNLKAAGLDVISYTPGEKGLEEQNQVEQMISKGRLLVTPHSAIPAKLISPLLGKRIIDNLERLIKGDVEEGGFVGLVDPQKGY
ncbi:uncharacterized protein MEPE_06661 [Melanopsichium pennsylvanicum]|uniref:D-isomer specific 2-hydroxyacid dehydrogenase NAD-binding domain-containing protein n=2 Tax=Melanopsichium pennsylvanicum TaxID=63383 RepID=A0AAJ4XS89_9BASI|nr:2-hydroxyacid dehydrogenase [Melanopsichium pennsylvanicum 4]SNX87950.1 uncharacterized protein MEPE_06661 [Melanopsichium pennsylvanicum]